jgi:CRISPR-associated protein Cas2
MIVLIVDKGKPSFRGELTRWLMQLRPGVFVGNLSARIRDKLWDKVQYENKCSSALMIYSGDTEQGFRIKSFGEMNMEFVDFDGYILPKTLKHTI